MTKKSKKQKEKKTQIVNSQNSTSNTNTNTSTANNQVNINKTTTASNTSHDDLPTVFSTEIKPTILTTTTTTTIQNQDKDRNETSLKMNLLNSNNNKAQAHQDETSSKLNPSSLTNSYGAAIDIVPQSNQQIERTNVSTSSTSSSQKKKSKRNNNNNNNNSSNSNSSNIQHSTVHVPANLSTAYSSTSINKVQPWVLSQAKSLLLFRHFMAALAQRMWKFAIVLLLSVIGPSDSFTLIAAYGITLNLIVGFLSPPLGVAMDKNDRLYAMVRVTIMQNICVIVCGLMLIYLLVVQKTPEDWQWHVAIAMIFLFGPIGDLFYGISTNMLERDWIIVIAGDDIEWRTYMTTNLKTVDYMCNLLGPPCIAALHIFGDKSIVVAISAINTGMIFLQFSAFKFLYDLVPLLSAKPFLTKTTTTSEKQLKNVKETKELLSEEGNDIKEINSYQLASLNNDTNDHSDDTVTDDDLPIVSTTTAPTTSSSSSSSSSGKAKTQRTVYDTFKEEFYNIIHLGNHAMIYFRQKSALAGMALAMLYLTVLSFHMVMITFLLWTGLSSLYVGIAQGISSLCGVVGTLIYPRCMKRLGNDLTGIAASWFQFACLVMASLSLYLARNEWGVFFFLVGVIISRFGLYTFDLAAVRIIQDLTEEENRGVVSGFQSTLQSFFELASFAFAFIYSNPSQFPYLCVISCLMTGLAAFLFTVSVLKRRHNKEKGYHEISDRQDKIDTPSLV